LAREEEGMRPNGTLGLFGMEGDVVRDKRGRGLRLRGGGCGEGRDSSVGGGEVRGLDEVEETVRSFGREIVEVEHELVSVL
jgi:hypothetical protein